MIKILEMFGEPITYGGQESVVYNMLSSFDVKRDNFKFDLFTPYYSDNKKLIDFISSNNGSIYSYNLLFKTNDNRLKLKKTVEKFFDNNYNYDVVHIHTGSLTTMYVYAKVAKKHNIKKVFVHSHIADKKSNFLKKIYKYIVNILLSKYVDIYLGCDANAIATKFGKDRLKESIVVNNGIDINKFKFNENYRSDIRQKYNLADKFVIGSLGRLTYQKNISFILNVLKTISNIDDKVILMIIGTGELYDELKSYARFLNIENKIIFAGNQTENYKFYNAFDCFVLPSFYEGLPVSAIEAQVSNLPTLISDNVTKNCKISNITYYLPINDVNLWVKKIIDIKSKFKNIDVRFSSNVDYDKYDNKKTFKVVEELYLSAI